MLKDLISSKVQIMPIYVYRKRTERRVEVKLKPQKSIYEPV